MEQIQDYLNKLTGARSVFINFFIIHENCSYCCCTHSNAFSRYKVPRVFIGGNFVGGGDDTARLDENGKLKILLQECGAIAVEEQKKENKEESKI